MNPVLNAQQGNPTVAVDEQDSIRLRLTEYMETFNQQNADEVAKYWSTNCQSIAEDSGERIEGRDSIRQHFTSFFADYPSARLVGEVTDIQMIRPDVACIEGRTTLLLVGEAQLDSVFSATLVKEGGDWLITHSRERDVVSVTSPSEALQELEWLIGVWQDQAENEVVVATIRWTPNRAFLIRSFAASFEAQEQQGTQVIGWDPRTGQIRTWIFNSDGSFGQGTVSKHDESWLFKITQTLSDGRLASGTQVVTRLDENTITVQTIGETVEGELLPSTDPITVVRTSNADGLPNTESGTAEGGK